MLQLHVQMIHKNHQQSKFFEENIWQWEDGEKGDAIPSKKQVGT